MLNKEEINEIKRQLAGELLPVGVILIFPYECTPDGFIPCDGRQLDKQEYRKLYELIGDTFGADATSFKIPDLRGKFVRGYDDSGIFDCNHPFGEYQMDALQGHSHKADWANQTTGPGGEHHHLYFAEPWNRLSGFKENGNYSHENMDYNSDSSFKKKTSIEAPHVHNLPDIHLNEIISSNQGRVRSATETRPKNIALNFCIKAK
ncbi:MAG: phage tail protein [Muribaculaceae bacterium]|nr:phage tail protein [Muribaculaceae bacterium]